MTEIPSSFYALIGILIVTNIGTVSALIVFIFKVGMFVARTNDGIKTSREMAIRAHKRIDAIVFTNKKEGEFDEHSL